MQYLVTVDSISHCQRWEVISWTLLDGKRKIGRPDWMQMVE